MICELCTGLHPTSMCAQARTAYHDALLGTPDDYRPPEPPPPPPAPVVLVDLDEYRRDVERRKKAAWRQRARA